MAKAAGKSAGKISKTQTGEASAAAPATATATVEALVIETAATVIVPASVEKSSPANAAVKKADKLEKAGKTEKTASQRKKPGKTSLPLEPVAPALATPAIPPAKKRVAALKAASTLSETDKKSPTKKTTKKSSGKNVEQAQPASPVARTADAAVKLEVQKPGDVHTGAEKKAVEKPVKAKKKTAPQTKAGPAPVLASASKPVEQALSQTQPKPAREFDVVLFGASSFVGRYVAEHLHARAREEGFRWAIAGRSAEKLDAVKQALGAPELPVLLADAFDAAALNAVAARCKAIASTVGPYGLYGSELLAACAAQGTDYCDLTAEIPWMRRMQALHADTAAASGARLVHGCGFDSIPSDLGTWFLQQEAMARFGEPCTLVKMRLKKASGGFSGGTIASLTDMVMQARISEDVRKLLLNPYALSAQASGPQKDQWLPSYDRDAGEWQAPFLMAPINSRVVQRTHSLLGQTWGQDFVYDEAMLTGRGPLGAALAGGVTVALGSLVGLLAAKPTRTLLQKILPAPGEGPSPQAVAKGFFEMHAYGKTARGDVIKVVITGERDPGYGATSRMLAESALALALDRDDSAVGGGFWTPATALGEKLLARLQTHAGMRFRVV